MPWSYNDPSLTHNQAILIWWIDVTKPKNSNIAKMLVRIKNELEKLCIDNNWIDFFPESFWVNDIDNYDFWDFIDFTDLWLSWRLEAKTSTIDITIQDLIKRLWQCIEVYESMWDEYEIHTEWKYPYIVEWVEKILNLVNRYKSEQEVTRNTVWAGKNTDNIISWDYNWLAWPQ